MLVVQLAGRGGHVRWCGQRVDAEAIVGQRWVTDRWSVIVFVGLKLGKQALAIKMFT